MLSGRQLHLWLFLSYAPTTSSTVSLSLVTTGPIYPCGGGFRDSRSFLLTARMQSPRAAKASWRVHVGSVAADDLLPASHNTHAHSAPAELAKRSSIAVVPRARSISDLLRGIVEHYAETDCATAARAVSTRAK